MAYQKDKKAYAKIQKKPRRIGCSRFW